MADWKKYLKDIYFNPTNPGAFAGPEKLYRIVKQENAYKISRSKIKQWLQDQDAFSLSKPIKRKFKRNRIIPANRDAQWDMDLTDVSNLERNNDGVKFLLVVIDLFSRYLWVQPLKGKTHQDILKGLQDILHKGRKPESVRSDKGSEFANRWVKRFMKGLDIYYFTSQNETKANYAERVIRSLKNLMYRYMFHNQTHRYINVLQDLVTNYNSRNRNRTPKSVQPNEALLWKSMYIDSLKSKQKKKQKATGFPQQFRYKVGDLVCISYLRHPFEQDYQEKWTEEVFVIKGRQRREGIPIYKLKDWNGEEIKGTFYQSELQKVNKSNDSLWRIEKVLKKE